MKTPIRIFKEYTTGVANSLEKSLEAYSLSDQIVESALQGWMWKQRMLDDSY